MALKKTAKKKKQTTKRQTQDEKIKLILECIADGNSERFSCSLHGLAASTFRDNVRRADSPYSVQYARAREDQAFSHSDRMLDLVDDVISGKLKPDAGRVAIDTLKWICSKMLPKVYGDKQQVDVVSSDGSMTPPTKFVVELSDIADTKEDIKEDNE